MRNVKRYVGSFEYELDIILFRVINVFEQKNNSQIHPNTSDSVVKGIENIDELNVNQVRIVNTFK